MPKTAVTRITHSCHLIEIGGRTFLTDPWFSTRPGYHQGEPIAIRIPDLPRLDGVLISHEHYDHCDLDAFAAYRDRTVPLFVAGTVVETARKHGFTNVTALEPWQEAEVGGVTIAASPSRRPRPSTVSTRSPSSCAPAPDPRERARAIGLWGTTVGLSLAAGPVVGGLLVASAGWRSIFWINIPIGLAALVLTAVFVPESRAATARRPDPVGQLLVVTILTSLIFAIIEGSHQGYGSTPIIALFALSAAALLALPRYERRREQPLVDPAFFRSVPFTGSFVAAVTAFLVLSGFLFLNTLYLQDVRGYGALHAGLLTMPLAVGTALASPLSGRLTALRGPRPPLVAAGLLIATATLTLTRLTPTTPWAVLLTAYVLLGIGFGLVNAPITSTAVAGMPRAQAGVSAAITTTGRQVGNNLGVAVLGAIVSARIHSPGRAGFAAASHPAWWILTACGLLIALIGLATTTPRATATAARVAARFPTDPATALNNAPGVRRGTPA